MEDKKRTPIYLTDDERRRIKIAAAYASLSMTEYIRQRILEVAEADISSAQADAVVNDRGLML